MPLFVKTQGVWKPAAEIDAFAAERWNKTHRMYVCVQSAGLDVVSFDDSEPPVTAVVSLNDRALDITPTRFVRITKASGEVFSARIESADVPEYPDRFTITWDPGTLNAPVAAAELQTDGTADFVVTQWRVVLQSAALPGTGETTTVPQTTGGDRAVFTAADTECVFFGTPGTHTFRVTRPGFCSIVLVGGGGGGGGSSRQGSGGGGGGGQVTYVEDHWLDAGEYDVVVGAGGRGGVAALSNTPGYSVAPTSGSASSFRGYVALGGGLGGLGVGGPLNGTRLVSGKSGDGGGSGGGGGSTNWAGTDGTFGGEALPGPAIPETNLHASASRAGNPGRRGTPTGVGGSDSGSGGDGGSAYYPAGDLSLGTAGVQFSEERGQFVPGARDSDSVAFSSLVFGKGGAGAPARTGSSTSSPGASAAANTGSGGGGAFNQPSDTPLSGGAGGSGLVYLFYNTDETAPPPGAGTGPGEVDADDGDLTVPATPGAGTPPTVGAGGSLLELPDWDIYAYTEPGTFTFEVLTPGVFDLVVLAGGGGAGCGHSSGDHHIFVGEGGSGGAGGAVVLQGLSLLAGSYQVRVGAGGLGGYWVSEWDINTTQLGSRTASGLAAALAAVQKVGIPYSGPREPTSGQASSFGGDLVVTRGGGRGGNPMYSRHLHLGPDLLDAFDGAAPSGGGCGGADGHRGPPSYLSFRRVGGVVMPTHPLAGFDTVEVYGTPGVVEGTGIYFKSFGGASLRGKDMPVWYSEAVTETLLPQHSGGGGGEGFYVPRVYWNWVSGYPTARGYGGGGSWVMPRDPDQTWTPLRNVAVGENGSGGMVLIARRKEGA